MTFDNWLKEKRTEFNLSQAKFAEKLGIKNSSTYTLLEGGKQKPTADELATIKKAIGEYVGNVETRTIHPRGWHLKKHRENKLNASPESAEEIVAEAPAVKPFFIQLDETTVIKADSHQYKLIIGGHQTYFIEFAPMLKHMIHEKVKTSSIESIEQVINKIDEVYKLINERFVNFDPAGIKSDFPKDEIVIEQGENEEENVE